MPWWAFEPISWKELLCCGARAEASSEAESEETTQEEYLKTNLGGDSEQELTTILLLH